MEDSQHFLDPLRHDCLNQSFVGWLRGTPPLTLEHCIIEFKAVLASSKRNITMTELMASLVKETRVVVARMAPDAFAKYSAKYARRLRRRSRSHRDRHKLKKIHKRHSEKGGRRSSTCPSSVTSEKVGKPWKRFQRVRKRCIELFGSDSESALPEPGSTIITGQPEPEPNLELIFEISDCGTPTDTDVKRKQPESKPLRSKLLFMESTSDEDDDEVQFMGTIYPTNNILDVKEHEENAITNDIREIKDDKENTTNNNIPEIKENEENTHQCVYERPCPKSKKKNVMILGNRQKIGKNCKEEEDTTKSTRQWNVKSTEATKVTLQIKSSGHIENRQLENDKLKMQNVVKVNNESKYNAPALTTPAQEATKATLQIKSPGHIESRKLENDKHNIQNVVKVNNQSIYDAPILSTSTQDVKATKKSMHYAHILRATVQDLKMNHVSVHNAHTSVQDENDKSIQMKEEIVNIKCSDNNIDAPNTNPVTVKPEFIIKSEIIEIDGVPVNENKFLSNYNQIFLEIGATKNLFETSNAKVQNKCDYESISTEDSSKGLPKLTLKPIESLLNQNTLTKDMQNAYEQIGPKISEDQENIETPNLSHRKSPNSCIGTVCETQETPGTNVIQPHRDTESLQVFVQSLAEYILCWMGELEKFRKSLEDAEKCTDKDIALSLKSTAQKHFHLNRSVLLKKTLPYFNPKSMKFFNNLTCTTLLNNATRKLASEREQITHNFNQNIYTEVLMEMVTKGQQHIQILGSDNAQNNSLPKNITASTGQHQYTEVPVQMATKSQQNTQIPGSDNNQIQSLSKNATTAQNPCTKILLQMAPQAQENIHILRSDDEQIKNMSEITTPNAVKINKGTGNQNLVTTNPFGIDNLDMRNNGLYGLQTSTNASVLNTEPQYTAHSTIVTNPQYSSANSKQTQIIHQYIPSERYSLPNSSAQHAQISIESKKTNNTHFENNLPSYEDAVGSRNIQEVCNNYVENSMSMEKINPMQNYDSPIDYSRDPQLQHYQSRNAILQQLLNLKRTFNPQSPTNEVNTRKESTNQHTPSMLDSLQNPQLAYQLKDRNYQTVLFPQNVGTSDSQNGISHHQSSSSSTYPTGNAPAHNMVRKRPASSINQNPTGSRGNSKVARQQHTVPTNPPWNNTAPSAIGINNSITSEHDRIRSNGQNYQKSSNRSYQNRENATHTTGWSARDPWIGGNRHTWWPAATSAPIQREQVRLPTASTPAHIQQDRWAGEWLTTAAAQLHQPIQWPTVAAAPIHQQMQWQAAALLMREEVQWKAAAAPVQEQRQWPTVAAAPMQQQRQWPGQQDQQQQRSASRDSGFMSPTAAGTSPAEPPAGKCKMCDVATTLRCTQCFAVFYCGVECQARDWDFHQIGCIVNNDNS